jgi:putative ABC transport system permease protein
VQFVSPTFFQTLRIPVLRGRAFTSADREDSAPVAIVNETMARTFFGGRSAVGRKVKFGMPGAPWLTVVGVVRDVHQKGLHQPAGSELYAPHRQASNVWGSFVPRELNVVVRVADGQDPASLAGAMRREVVRLDPGLAVAGLRTMDTVMRRSVAQPRFLAIVLGTFAAAALVLAAVGVYGAVSYGVAQRMPEFAVRVALGAAPRDVLSLALRHGLAATAGGLLLGVAGALGAGRLLSAWLFRLAPTDGPTLAAVAGLLGGVAAIACVLPARRATQIDPATLMRD